MLRGFRPVRVEVVRGELLQRPVGFFDEDQGVEYTDEASVDQVEQRRNELTVDLLAAGKLHHQPVDRSGLFDVDRFPPSDASSRIFPTRRARRHSDVGADSAWTCHGARGEPEQPAREPQLNHALRLIAHNEIAHDAPGQRTVERPARTASIIALGGVDDDLRVFHLDLVTALLRDEVLRRTLASGSEGVPPDSVAPSVEHSGDGLS